MAHERNPIFIPDRSAPKGPVCPACGEADFLGRKVMGVITFTCKKCQHKWQGGLPQEPIAPGTVLPAESHVPPVRFFPDSKSKEGFVEVRTRIDTRPDFKKGAPLPEGDE